MGFPSGNAVKVLEEKGGREGSMAGGVPSGVSKRATAGTVIDVDLAG